jgi:hypothetical protein
MLAGPAWLSGRSSLKGSWARLNRSRHPAFTLITPDGRYLTRTATLNMLRGAAGAEASLRITIADATVVHQERDLVVGSYVESHTVLDTSETRRRATAVLLRDPRDHRAWLWRHLHETWFV